MATLELERVKAAIAASDLDEARELAAALEARFASLGMKVEVRVGDSNDDDVAPELRVPETWAEIEADLARHHAGEKGFDRAHMHSSLGSPAVNTDI